MASKSKQALMKSKSNITRSLLYWSIFGLMIKIVIIFNIQPVNVKIDGESLFTINGIWAGSDAEAYMKGFKSLVEEGIFSENGILNYWPAGYPILIYILSLISGNWTLTFLAILQSLFFSFSVYHFTLQLSRTRMANYSKLVLIFIIFNPTLTLTSLWIGYENLVASGFLLMISIILKDLIEKKNSQFIKYLLLNSIISGVIIFVQPRFVVSTLTVNVIWIILRHGFKKSIGLILVLTSVTLIFPAALVFRNYQSTGLPVISTNLGVTMNLGAGDNATGSYRSEGQGVDCDVTGLDPAEADAERVKCVLNWYLKNPTKVPKLFLNKSLFFWSPWAGPEGNGTMGRNPWLKIHPIRSIAATSDGANLVFGNLGKSLSRMWLFGGITMLFYGFLILWKQRGIEKFLGSSAILIVVINWLISLITIGDHRFRIPIMGLSLFLQVVGIKTLFRGGKPSMVVGPSLR